MVKFANSIDTPDECIEPSPLFLIGAQKSGSTFLYEIISQDPEFATSDEKEPSFFSKPCYDRSKFQKLFSLSKESRFMLDASTSYLHVAGTSEQIEKRLGLDVFVLAVLRDPVERAISGYLHELKHGRDLRKPDEVFRFSGTTADELIDEENLKVKEAFSKGLLQLHYPNYKRYRDQLFQFRYISNSFYGIQLRPWLKFDSIRIIDFRELVNDTLEVIARMRAWLELGSTFKNILEVPQNKTEIGYLRACKQYLRLPKDVQRPFSLVAFYRLIRAIHSAKKDRIYIPENVQTELLSEWSKLKDKEQLWL